MISGWSRGRRAAGGWRAWRALTLTVVAAVAAINVVATVRRVPPAPAPTGQPPADVVMRYEARYKPVRLALTEHRVSGTIGYIGGETVRSGAEPDEVLDYLLSQFALAPWVLDNTYAAHAWVVANLRQAELPEIARSEYVVVNDFGGGLALLKRRAER